MGALALFFSARGRVAPRAFAAAVMAVYGAAFLSQLLTSAPVMLRAGLAPFALAQAIATWSWLCLHAKRLRDADRAIGAAVAIAVLYALAVILFLLLVALIMPLGDAAQAASGGGVLALSFLISTLIADPRPFASVASVLAPGRVPSPSWCGAGRRPAVTSAQPSPARVAARCVAPDRSSANRTG